MAAVRADMQEERTQRALQYLGLATRAGRVVVGVPLICTALSKGAKGKTPVLVVKANDASANTAKRITDRCAHYGVPLLELACDCSTLAQRIGKGDAAVAAVGVIDESLSAAIRTLFEHN